MGDNSHKILQPTVFVGGVRASGTTLVSGTGDEEAAMGFLSNRRFWERKVRLAALTLATFVALC